MGINNEQIRNRSIPIEGILPHVFYQNVADALIWLTITFGFKEHYRYGVVDGQISGAQLSLGTAWIMLKAAGDKTTSPKALGYLTQMLTVFVDDVDTHYAKAKSQGVRIVEGLNETVYGERQYVAEDPEGHQWLFSMHIHDKSPDEWGAIIAES